MTTTANILPGHDPDSVRRAAQVLAAGGLVGMPTETVYGLAANALDVAAAARIFEAKGRPSFDPLIVHTRDAGHAEELAVFSDTARRLAQAFWPGPLTLVLPRRLGADNKPIVPDLVTSGLDSVGLRVPAHPVAQALLEQSRLPLAAPSANRFGSISPTTAQHVADELGGKADVILDGGPCQRGVESTVARVTGKGVEVLRLGALPVEDIERLAGGPVTVLRPSSSPGVARQGEALPAPGMTQRHYAPATPLLCVDSIDALTRLDVPGRLGLIVIGPSPGDVGRFAAVRSLSEKGDLPEAAARLFATLRELDGMGLNGIVATAAPDQGLGRAINDRLRRGSTR